MPDRVIFGKMFDPQGICEDQPFQVSTNISLAKNGGHFFWYVSKLVYPIFQKKLPFPKMGVIVNFVIVAQL